MTIFVARKKLAILWISFFFITFIILVIESTSGFYEADTSGVWKWFLPHIIPTVSLILTVFSQTKKNLAKIKEITSVFYYRVCFLFSLFYLLLLTFLTLSGPWALEQGNKPLDFLNQSNIWLAAIQSLVAICIGWFFWKNKSKD